MIGIKVKLKDAEKVKKHLFEKDLFDREYLPMREKDSITFPIIKEIKLENAEIVHDAKFKVTERTEKSLKDALADKLSSEELNILKTAYDTVGDIAILEIDEELRSKEKLIAETLLNIQKQIKVIARKDGSHEGEFRTQKVRVLAGENRLETTYLENGIKIRLNVETVYFSPRLSTERKRINSLVKHKEEVLVMFSGSGVYPINIAKNTKAKHIVGIEINPEGHRFAKENIILNKVKNVELHLGDVKEVIPNLKKLNPNLSFDRILMPLPKSAEDFLDTALSVSKKGTVIHFYDFLHEDQFDLAKQKIDAACKKNNKEYKILALVKCGQHAPRVYRICVDFEIL